MTSFAWLNDIGGDWNHIRLWTESVVSDSDEAIASIAAPGTYTVEITADHTETVNLLDLIADGAMLSVDGTLPYAGVRPFGDSIITGRGTERPIVRIAFWQIDGRQQPHPEQVQLVRMAAHGFGSGWPSRDLFISRDMRSILPNF